MKKYAKIAAVCAATLLAFLFFGCSDDSDGDGGGTSTSSSSPSTSGPLAAPSGADPFTAGTYKASAADNGGGNIDIMFSKGGESYNGDYWKIDKTNRTITLYGSSEELDDLTSEVTYTYNETEKTVTIKLSKVAVPQDVAAYIKACESNKRYEYKDWKLGSQSEVIEYVNAVAKSDWSDADKYDGRADAYRDDFAATVTYKYAKSGDNITLELSKVVGKSTEKITLSPQP